MEPFLIMFYTVNSSPIAHYQTGFDTNNYFQYLPQAWNSTQATEATASVALVLALVPLQKFPMTLRFSNGSSLCKE